MSSKKRVVIISIISFIVLLGVIFVLRNYIEELDKKGKEDEVEDDMKYYLFTINEMRDCTNWKKIYYIDSEDRNYYLYCLEDVIINFNDGSISLYEALENDKITIDEVISYLTQKNWFSDGGTILYKDDGAIKHSKNGFSILNCKSVNPIGSKEFYNMDIYIGPLSMDYEKGFCKQKN